MQGYYVGYLDFRTYVPGSVELAYYREQQKAAKVANYRVCWACGKGYYGQAWAGNCWADLEKVFPSHAEAVVDCHLHARHAARIVCRLHPLIANMTPGRNEYDVDLSQPFPGWK